MSSSPCRRIREGVEAVWESLSPVEKDVWLDFLSSKAYDATDHYLVVNEFQAYLFQQDREGVDGFQALTLSRMKARGELPHASQPGCWRSILTRFSILSTPWTRSFGLPEARRVVTRSQFSWRSDFPLACTDTFR